MIKCTVCIPTYHRPDNLNMILASILAMDDCRIGEVIVGVTGEEKESINQTTLQLNKALCLKGIDIWYMNGLTGICDAKQKFKDNAKNEVMLFCDDDGIFDIDYLDLLDWFKDKRVGAVSGSLQTPINIMGYKQWDDSRVLVDSLLTRCNTLKMKNGSLDWSDKLQVYMIADSSGESCIYDCEYLIGTCLFVRKSALEIDMNFQSGACAGEEIDFTYSMFKRGYRLIFDSSRVAWHMHSMTGGNRGMDRSKDDANMTYLVQKWGLGTEVKGETVYE